MGRIENIPQNDGRKLVVYEHFWVFCWAFLPFEPQTMPSIFWLCSGEGGRHVQHRCTSSKTSPSKWPVTKMVLRCWLVHFAVFAELNTKPNPNPTPTKWIQPNHLTTQTSLPFQPDNKNPTLFTHCTPLISTSPKLSHQMDLDHAPWCEAKEPHEVARRWGKSPEKSWGSMGRYGKGPIFVGKMEKSIEHEDIIHYYDLLCMLQFLWTYLVLITFEDFTNQEFLELIIILYFLSSIWVHNSDPALTSHHASPSNWQPNSLKIPPLLAAPTAFCNSNLKNCQPRGESLSSATPLFSVCGPQFTSLKRHTVGMLPQDPSRQDDIRHFESPPESSFSYTERGSAIPLLNTTYCWCIWWEARPHSLAWNMKTSL